jgi:xanthine dehydrogenase molybdopterin binding subunit
MGGAFGGKETQANHTACWTALLAHATGRPVKIRLCRDDDQKMTGKRHPYLNKYKVGFDSSGRILAAEFQLNSNAGAAMDLSFAIMERALFHIDNAYYIPNLSVTGKMWRTNLPPNTALRGFGAPQALVTIENIIDRISRHLKLDPVKIRKRNFYGIQIRNLTHYGQKVERNHLHKIYGQIVTRSDYFQRRKKINVFNSKNEFIKRGLALSPVKFGISFTTSFLNQAGALVHIYQDGTVLVNHGGTEMGQGLHTKIQQIAALELGICPGIIRINATDTSKVSNTSATAASSGTDLNGMAVKDAINQLKNRLTQVAAKILGYPSSDTQKIIISDNFVYHKKFSRKRISFQEVVRTAYLERVSLSAAGFYRTPDINWNPKTGKGKPFNYYAFGMAVSEIELDILTGRHRILRTDILHDVGDSINLGIDLGQIEGGFIQGLGWCTTEECKWDAKGNLLNHSPDTYKIPAIRDIPEDFRVTFLDNEPNPRAIRKSKAVGEPPLMLAISVWLAIKDAISAVLNHTIEPDLPVPATNEAILICIDQMKTKS